MKAKRTSLEDIARAVGVSKATVSFVLNGKGDEYSISKEKQKIIRQKAKELLYVPNFFAKSLRQGETKTIGLVVSDISNLFYAQLCKEIQEQLYNKGYNVFIVNTNEDIELEKTLMRELIQRSVDGIIISPSNRIDGLIPILNETHIPVVFIDRKGDENADFIGVDNYEEAKKLVYCFSKHPQKLAVILPENNSIAITLEQRIEGIKDACEELEIQMKPIHLSNDQNEVDKSIQSILAQNFDSLIVLNNQIILKILTSLKNNNVKIGVDVRLICFDDDEAFSLVSPSITALRQPVSEIGVLAVERLFARMKQTLEPGVHDLRKCELIIRQSH